jgi:hypothetical protein
MFHDIRRIVYRQGIWGELTECALRVSKVAFFP